MVLQEIQERSEIKREYNSLIKDLQKDGHEVTVSGKKSPLWQLGRRPGRIHFETRSEKDALLSKEFVHGIKHAERVAELLQKIEKHYGNHITRRPVIEHVRFNLLGILTEMKSPRSIDNLAGLLSDPDAEGKGLTLADLDPEFRKDIEKTGVQRKALLERLARYKFPNPALGHGALTPKGRKGLESLVDKLFESD